ncbi:prepilin-type N-terminal cleavage/methylation domain-containing protein [Clostridium cellulovorans]|uniref:Prepilin-type N-terminal cleavage/methylation domain-containing protein n=1 Tax=Clostridium cellulovorans (strain ATCC 35296 / DSM 3052 / OCM 3 / 743B) TaxID=573061 RepID=D9SLE4_CLOC7|nr:prepilin-type N-terminal cleavage/methylation domain-containing protein [Clostridium cellulovorans]ADL51660.1 hypothetical protein Clocel_1916 [Clostridium cellulovorans 743B]
MEKKYLRAKRAYTLIEVLLAITIMSVITLMSFNFYNHQIKMIKEIEDEFGKKDLITYVYSCKSYCLENQIGCTIMINPWESRKLMFIDGYEIVSNYALPKGQEFICTVFGNNSSLMISKEGKFLTSGRIVYKNSRNKQEKLIINVNERDIYFEE